MRLIRKSPEPKVLVEYRALPDARYDHLETDDKAAVRAVLVRDQGGLCCYCMQRIHDGPKTVRIEHWKDQSNHPDRDLDWTNLFAACQGNEGKLPRDQHCDVRKGDRDIVLSPLEAKHVASLSYTGAGEIHSTDEALQQDIDDALHLNHEMLQNNRKSAVQALVDGLISKQKKAGKPGAFPIAKLAAELSRCNEPDHAGRLPPYAGALAHWLKRRLGQHHKPSL